MNTNDKINQDFLAQYGAVFSEKLLHKAFDDKIRLSGKDILNISAIKQLNLFVIKSFFTDWQEEVKKLKSPLFDYTAVEVRRSLVDFMNILSQHISIGKSDLKPYVEKALKETILLTKDPYTYLLEEFSEKKSVRITSKMIKGHLKYIVIHKELLLDFFTSVEGESMRESLSKAELFFEDIDTEDQIEQLLQELSKYLVVDQRELFIPTFRQGAMAMIEEEDEEVDDDDIEEENEGLSAGASDYFGQAVDRDSEIVKGASYEADFEILEEEEREEEQMDTLAEETQAKDFLESVGENRPQQVGDEKPTEDELVEEEDDFVEEETDDMTHHEASALAQQEVEEEHSINQKYESEHKTLAEMHEGKKIESVFDAISINHRYMFLQELFDGDNELFNEALKEVDTCETFDEAVEMLVQNYAKEFFWDMNSDEVKELLKVVYRKFRS